FFFSSRRRHTRSKRDWSSDVCSSDLLNAVFERFRPQAVVNAIGIIKQRPESEDAIVSLEVNSLLPHRLAVACRAAGAQLVQLSKIGRASCRERVDVSELEVAVATTMC